MRTAVVNGDGKTVLGEGQNEGSTDPSGTSGHQRRFGNRGNRYRPGGGISRLGLTPARAFEGA